MKKIDIGQIVQLLANVGVIAGLIFVGLEIRTNTASNNIAIDQSYAGNWMTINSTIATNPDVAALLERGLADEELTKVQLRQFDHLTHMFLTQVNHMLRLYDRSLISEAGMRDALGATRELAQHGRFRERIQAITNERLKGLILEEDVDTWLNAGN